MVLKLKLQWPLELLFSILSELFTNSQVVCLLIVVSLRPNPMGCTAFVPSEIAFSLAILLTSSLIQNSPYAICSLKKVVLPVSFDLQLLANKIGENCNLQFYWIPGHSGIVGNDLALLSLHVKSIIHLHLSLSWEADWSSSVTRSPVRLFIRKPSDAKIFHDFPLHYCLSQLLPGHLRLNSFVHHINPLIAS